jgi:hypothetical protein
MDEEQLRVIYPSLTDAELREAEENLNAYFSVALQIAREDRLESVDKSDRQDTIEERSRGSLKNISLEHG